MKAINKVLEIDLDTSRDTQRMQILQLASVPRGRSRQPDRNWDAADNVEVLTMALATMIRSAEENGAFKTGDGMAMAMQRLQDYYVDPAFAPTAIKVPYNFPVYGQTHVHDDSVQLN